MAISELIEVVPPPAQPLDASDGGLWVALEEKLGLQLPSDWRDFGLHYGSGEFGTHGGFRFWNPFAPSTLGWIEQVIRILRSNKEDSPEYGVTYDLHPARPGLLPWGIDVNGGYYCWLTEGPPEEWPVIFFDHEYENKPEKFALTMTSFITKLVSGDLSTVTEATRAESFTVGRTQAEVAARLCEQRPRLTFR